MSNELGPFSAAKKIVIFNPDAPTEVRQVSGSGSPQYVSVGSGTFSECVTSTGPVGAFHWASLPTGLDANTAYAFAAYASTATAFTDACEIYQYDKSVAEVDEGVQTFGSITVTPAVANSSNPRYSTKKMANLGKGSAPQDVWTFVDANGDPIDLSGKTIRVVFATVTSLGDDDESVTDDTLSGIFKYETGGAGLTIGGSDNNQVTLQHSDTKLATAGHYRFFWWNVTDKILLAKGSVDIEPTVFDV